MTTDYHDALGGDDPLTPAAINAPLQQLDLQLVKMDNGEHPFSAPDIDGGTIDGAVIGADSAQPVTATDLIVTGNINVGSSFKAHRNNATQSITNGGYAAIQWTHLDLDNNEDFDDETDFDITPSVAGWYFLFAVAQWNEALAAGKRFDLQIATATSTEVATTRLVTRGTFAESLQIGALVNANGTTDNYKVLIYNGDTGAKDLSGSKAVTYFAGWRVR